MAGRVDDKRMIAVGVITAAHGIRGAVKIKPFTEAAENLEAYGALRTSGGDSLRLSVERRAGNLVIARIDGIDDRSAAEALKKTMLYVCRDQLPDDDEAWYQADLIGAEVIDAQGDRIGEAAGFFDFGGGEVIEVMTPSGERVMLPFAPALRLEVAPADKRIRLEVDPVWLEPAAKKNNPQTPRE